MRRFKVRQRPRNSGLGLALVVLLIVFGLATPSFLTPTNVAEVLRNAALVGVVALGSLLTLIVGQIDVSVGSIVGVSGMVAFNVLTVGGLPWWAAVAMAVLTGATLGAVNAFLVVRLTLPSILVTLGTLTAYSGITRLISTKRQVAALGIDDQQYAFLGGGSIGPVPVPALIFGLLAIAIWWLLRSTGFGLAGRAIGGNPQAAARAGLSKGRTVAATLVISGALAGVSGVLLTSLLTTSTETLGRGYEFTAIVAAVVGGASLAGGKGSVSGLVLALLFLSFLANGMILVGIPPELNLVVTGSVLVAAVGIDESLRSRVRYQSVRANAEALG